MILLQIKNFEGLSSTKVDNVSGIFHLPIFTFKCARCMEFYLNGCMLTEVQYLTKFFFSSYSMIQLFCRMMVQN